MISAEKTKSRLAGVKVKDVSDGRAYLVDRAQNEALYEDILQDRCLIPNGYTIFLIDGDDVSTKVGVGAVWSKAVPYSGGVPADAVTQEEFSARNTEVDERIDEVAAINGAAPYPITGLTLPQTPGATDLPDRASAVIYGDTAGRTYTQTGGSPITVSENKGRSITYNKSTNLWTGGLEFDVPQTPVENTYGDSETSASSQKLTTDVRGLIITSEQITETITTPIASGSVLLYNTGARRIADRTLIWESGDILKSLYLPIQAQSAPTLSTILYIYSGSTVVRQYDLGIPVIGDNNIDLTSFNIVLGEGEEPVLQRLSYNGNIASSNRFYDLATSSFVTVPYYFSYTFDRPGSIVETNKITDLEEKVEDLQKYSSLKDKVIVFFGDSSIQSSNWAQRVISEFEMSPLSRIHAQGGFTYATRYNDQSVMVNCLRVLIQQFETAAPTLIPDIFFFNIGGNDYWLYEANNSILGSADGAFYNHNYLAIDDTLIFNAIRRNLEYIKRKYPNSTIMVGTPFQVALASRKVIADAVIEMCDRLSIKVIDGNREVGISRYLECINPAYNDNPGGNPTTEYPRYNWVEPNGSVVTLAAKTDNAVKRYGLYTYDGTHQNIERGRDRVFNYMSKSIEKNF